MGIAAAALLTLAPRPAVRALGLPVATRTRKAVGVIQQLDRPARSDTHGAA